jgi:hypothetical protein
LAGRARGRSAAEAGYKDFARGDKDVTRDQGKQRVAEMEQGSTPLSKTEAIRQAIAVLGSNAQVPQILDYVRDHFGIGSGGSVDSTPDRPGEPAGRPEALAGPVEQASNPQTPRGGQAEAEEPAGDKRSTAKRGKPRDRPASP